jgi:hypothetical protein
MSDDDTTRKIIELYWRSFPSRDDAAKVMASATIIVGRLGVAKTQELMRAAAQVAEKSQRVALVVEPGRAVCLAASGTTGSATQTEIIGAALDVLVGSYRDAKKREEFIGTHR